MTTRAHGAGPEGDADTAAVIAAAAGGDEQAWRTLLAMYARRVYALARSRCRSDELAEEITQSVFATVAAAEHGVRQAEQKQGEKAGDQGVGKRE